MKTVYPPQTKFAGGIIMNNGSSNKVKEAGWEISFTIHRLTLSELVETFSSADNIHKQFGPRSGPTECWSCSGSKLFDTLIVFLKEFLETVNF